MKTITLAGFLIIGSIIVSFLLGAFYGAIHYEEILTWFLMRRKRGGKTK